MLTDGFIPGPKGAAIPGSEVFIILLLAFGKQMGGSLSQGKDSILLVNTSKDRSPP